MKVLIGSNLIDTEMICEISEIEFCGFNITFIGGQTKRIRQLNSCFSKYQLTNAIEFDQDTVSKITKYFDSQHLPKPSKLKDAIHYLLQDAPLRNNNVFLFHEDANEHLVNLRQRLINVWEPNQTKILRLD